MRIVALSVAIAGASILVWGCSGAIAPFNHGGDAGTDGPYMPPGDDCIDCDATPPEPSPPGDGGPGPGPACPSTQPSEGTPCTRESLECEYGTSQYPGCDVIVQCSGGYWGTEFGAAGYCPTGPNPEGCPASMDDVNDGGATCSTQGLTCHYALGQCYCGDTFGPPVQPQDGGTYPWSCDDPGPGCPQPRARLGSPCTQEGQTCQYLACDWAQQCTGGVWASEPEGCAQAGGGASP
ncbi:MAG TPA: hypothetical protein VF765_23300 [Polyangiaceae bacterium]